MSELQLPDSPGSQGKPFRISPSQRQMLFELFRAQRFEIEPWHVLQSVFSRKTVERLSKLRLIEQRSGNRYRLTAKGLHLVERNIGAKIGYLKK